MDLVYLAKHGDRLNVETYVRQRRDLKPVSAQHWRRSCEEIGRIPGFEAWGAWVRGSLAAYVLTAQIEDCSYIEHQGSATEFLHFFPNNALTFIVTKEKLARPEVSSVCYGYQSLTREGLDQYKARMGFELKSLGGGVVFNPLVQAILVLGGRSVLGWMARRHPEKESWRSAWLFLKQRNC
jgi:hypothetical protein